MARKTKPPARKATPPAGKRVETLHHAEAKRRNIPTAEYQSVIQKEAEQPLRVAYERRNRDLDPQLVWRGKDQQDWSDLVVQAPPLYIQEKVHPKALIDDLLRQTRERRHEAGEDTPDLFADFNGMPTGVDKTEFYQHDQNWSNRMILGDSLQVMASLAEREGLRGKVQCIYIDPPYGIRFNSNFQWSTTSRDVKDGNAAHITREPEQVRAFRDTWRDGIHSYLTYLRDRLTVARDLLAESGSIFVQIGDENVHRVRALMDEVFGGSNFISLIAVTKTSSSSGNTLSAVNDYLVWYSKDRSSVKYRQLYLEKEVGGSGGGQYTWAEDNVGQRKGYGRSGIEDAAAKGLRIFRPDNMTSQRPAGDGDVREFVLGGDKYTPGKGTFKTEARGLAVLARATRLIGIGRTLCYVRFLSDFPVFPIVNSWDDTGISGFGDPKGLSQNKCTIEWERRR
ncbi:MAG: DNA methyltransferase [Candidatus Rokuibacteriota bacterium]